VKGLRKIALSKIANIGQSASKVKSLQTLMFNSIRLNRSETSDLIESDEIKFLAYCLSRRSRSRSQIMQDLWVCFELGEKTGGFFVEFGATNGKRNSNTWLLEKEENWTGILAEPNPFWHTELAINRNGPIEHRCVSSRSNDVVTFLTTNDSDPELSGIAQFSDGDHFSETRKNGEKIEISTISLDDLLKKYDAPQVIDYMSIDTEGNEYDILSSYSFKHKFKLISVESNPKNDDKIESLLASKGYRRVFQNFSQWDGWYIAEQVRSERNLELVAPES
jgi:FkbM family methyltransferase